MNGAFDAVVCMGWCTFRAAKRIARMGEMARVVAPGGLLALRVSALDILRSRHSEFAMERQRFTRSRLVRLAEEHGFAMRGVSYVYANSLSGWLDRMLYAPLAELDCGVPG